MGSDSKYPERLVRELLVEETCLLEVSTGKMGKQWRLPEQTDASYGFSLRVFV